MHVAGPPEPPDDADLIVARDKYLRELVARHEAVEHASPRGTLDLSLAYATVTEVASPGLR